MKVFQMNLEAKLLEAIETEQGFSIPTDQFKQMPCVGYMVGGFGFELRVTKDVLKKQIKQISELVSGLDFDKDSFIGGWFNKDVFCLDISKYIRLVDDAIRVGKHNNQDAIYEIESNKDIYL